MKKTFFLTILISVCTLMTWVHPNLVWGESSCDYYASPEGGGVGLSSSTAFKINDFWNVAGAGETLCLLDGTYTGADSMITPPKYLAGTAENPITIKALNDGNVTIDAQNKRRPVKLYYNDYFILEGFNAHSAFANGEDSASVVEVSRGNHNIVRRVVAWDAEDANANIFGTHHGDYNLFEDVAGFGIARKIFSSSYGGNHTTLRRTWGRWDGSHYAGPKMTYTMAYNNYHMLAENVIGTWSGEKMQSSYTLKCSSNNTYSKCGKTFSNYKVDQPYSIFGRDRLGKDLNANSKLLGSIAYVTQNDKFPPQTQYLINKLDSVELHNNVAWFEPGSYLGKNTFGLYGLSGGGGTNLIAEDLTGIGGTGMSVGQEWQTKNIVEGVDVSGVGNIFTDPSGAQICNRYQDGILTSEPLWPWPMNQRIIDGMVEAGRDPVDVTATIEGMFGTIPDECRWDKTGTAILSPDPTPDPITSINRTTTSFKTLAPITLDGNLAESAWSQSNAVTFRNTARSDNETTVHTLYDDTNLYFAFDVIDAQLEATGQALWKDDGNEIYMDVGHNASATVDGNDYHFIINKDDVNSGLVVMSKTVTSAKGYIMEVAIPWSSLGISAPSADQVMGLLLANNDMDNGKITQYDWQGLIETGGYRRPNLWGDLIFSAFTVGAPPIDYSPPVLIPGQSSCDFYAAPLGTGNGILETTPFKISDFWNVAGAGATLCLLDGTYTGKNSMIIPPSGFTGTEENPITVRALNDGKVLIDGQFVRQPVWISGVKWFVVEGINAAHSGPSGGRSVVLVSGGSEDIIIRRVIAWDTTATDNAHVFATNRAKRVLFEDVAGFGIGRKIFEPYKSDGVIFRRAWGKWEGSSAIGPRHTFSMSYHSVNTITENVIGTWDGSGSQLIGVFATNRLDPNDHPQGLKANNKLLGSIAYIDSGATYKAIGVTFINPDTIRDGDNFDHLELRDLVSYLPPGEFLDKRTIHLDKYTAGIPESLIASNLTSIGGSGTFIANGWTANNIEEGATVQDVSNIFTGTTGAKVCNQYVDGVLTSEALWPWPMNQRIIDAMKRSGRDPVDVTSTIESMFGAIPDECRWDGADPIDPIDRTTTSFKTLAPITLDGNLAESVWSESSAVTFSNAARSDNQTTVYTLYDDANLYFAFDVMDGQLEAPGVALWKDDGNEIYVDVGHNASTMIDGNDYHFIITKGDKISGPAVMSKTSPTATGYIMEIAIPWSSLGTSAPSAGQVMGLLLSNNDMDNGKIKQYDWQDLIETGGYRRPNLWGDLILSSQSVGNVPTDDGGIGVPVPDFTANVTSGAAPLAVQFTDTSSHSPTAWWWEFGDGATSPKQSPSHMYQSDGTYSIKFWAANAHGGNGDNDFVQKTGFITVNSSAGSGGGGDGGVGVPIPNFTVNISSGPAPLAVQFTDTSSKSPTAWWWEFGDGATSPKQSPSHVYQSDGTYSIKFWAANAHGGNGDNDFVQKTGFITVNSSAGSGGGGDGGGGVPVPNFTVDSSSGPAPLAVQFSDTSSHSPTAWWWEFGDGATSAKQSPSHVYQADGTYSVKLWAANAHGGNGDNDFVQKTGFITVNSSAGSGGGGDGGGGVPVPDFTANVTSGAAPLAVQFTDTSSNSPTTWWWEFGDGATSAEQSPSHVYQADGTYSVKLWAANAHGGNGANDFVQKTGFITVSLTGDVYYIAPDGADNNLGTSTTLPWGTFAHAMSKLLPGDTLYLMDGTYTGANKGTGTSAILHITVSGTTNQPIIIKAVNDGQAIIDGNNIRKTLLISNQSNLTLEGLIIKNSSWSSLEIGGVSDLVLRRISAYNGVGGFSIFGGSDNILIEDCIASGTGRLQYNIRKSKNVIVRRCWGRSQSEELGGAPFQIYGSDDGIIENSIGLGDSTKKNGTGLIVWCNSDNVSADRNKIYGNVMYGMKGSGYSDASKNHRTEDNTFLNNISINNKFGFSHRGDANLLVDKMTWAGTKNGIFALSEFPFDKPKDSDYEIYGNIKNSVFYSGTSGINFVDSSVVRGLDHDYNNFYDVTTNYIKTSPGAHERYIQPQYDEATYGKGAYLMRSSNLKGFGENGSDIGGEVIYRYENGVLTDKPLWPWPMEERIQKETKEILGQCMSATWEDAGNGCVGGLWKTLDGVYSGNPTPDPDPQPEPEPEPQPEPTVPLDKFITSLKSLSLISIDGHLAEDVWNQAKMVNFSNASRSDNQTTVYTLYDDTNLYFAFDVMDGQLEAPGVALWKDDGNEIYMDVGHNASATMDGNDYHFTITKDDLTAGPAVMSKTSPTATGYIMEIAIPWSSLGTSTPSAGQVMGLLLDNNDMDNGKSRQYDWQDLIESGGYGRPNVWGDLIFSALTVGTPPVVDPEPTPEPQPTTTGNLFQKHSTWYEKIPDNPVLNPNSAKYIAQQKSVSRFDRFIFSYGEWSMPIYYAKESDPLVTVNIKPCPARNEWAGTQRCKRIEYFGWNLKVPMNNTFRPAGDGATTFRDGHIAIISADKKTLYEIAQFKPSIMEAKLVKQFDLLSDGIQQPFSAEFDNAKGGNINVSPVARIHGLVTYDEVAAGVIPHAVSISLTGIVNAQDNRLNDNVYPAKTTNSGWTDSQWSPRLGHRFQLDPTLDLDDPKNFGGKPLSVGQKVIAKAMQEYGGIFIINDAPNGFNNIYLEDLEFDKSRSWSDKDVNIFGEGKMLLDHLRIIEPLKPPFANVPEPTPTPEPDPTPTPTPTPEPTPEPQPSATGNFFQKHSTWYEKIPANPVLNPDSQNYVSRINETAAGRRMTYSYREWSVPIYYATQDDPIVDFRCFEVGSNICNTMAYHDWNLNIPLPSNAKQAGWGDTGYRDGHMVIISPDRQFAWQFFRADVDNLKTSTVKKLDLSGDGIMQPLPVPYDYTSPMVANARVGRTPLLHGLVTYDEVKTGVIEHAIAYAYGGIGDQYALGRTNSVYPSEQNSALYASGWHDDQWSPKLGHRYQLDPTLDINDPADWGGLPLSAGQKVIAKAMQEYGIIYVENGGPRTSAVYLENVEYDDTRDWKALDVNIFGSGKILAKYFRLIEPLKPPFANAPEPTPEPTPNPTPEPTPEPQPSATGNFFQKHSTWYEKIPANPVLDPDSQKYMDQMMSVVPYSGLVYVYKDWSSTLYYAKESDPRVTINVKPCPDKYEWSGVQRCNRIEHFGWNLNVPMPAGAVPSGWNTGSFKDWHIFIISPDRKTLYDMAQFKPEKMEAKVIKQFDLTGDGIQQPMGDCQDPTNPHCTNASVSPVTRLHGMVTYEEVKSGVINHVLAMTLTGDVNSGNGTNRSVYPAETTNSGWTDSVWSPKLGHRFQLDPTLDLDDPNNFGGKALSIGEKVIAKALQVYGGIYMESGGDHNINLEDLEFDSTRSWSDKEVDIFGGGKIRFKDFSIIKPLKPPFVNTP